MVGTYTWAALLGVAVYAADHQHHIPATGLQTEAGLFLECEGSSTTGAGAADPRARFVLGIPEDKALTRPKHASTGPLGPAAPVGAPKIQVNVPGTTSGVETYHRYKVSLLGASGCFLHIAGSGMPAVSCDAEQVDADPTFTIVHHGQATELRDGVQVYLGCADGRVLSVTDDGGIVARQLSAISAAECFNVVRLDGSAATVMNSRVPDGATIGLRSVKGGFVVAPSLTVSARARAQFDLQHRCRGRGTPG